ncbi:hypothetical protein [Halarsenatibacter silvermanii]|uniref:Lipopolysaccharide kinase (Kdo/WaaP) family protein n=1 Tax=Halarsenatibacter silvermanii TaxID=321763 RepID=A0A1G9HZL9_9FIRM|nr:hypothetical protein [Halarsenatibacter silvermanii]SDL18409.1 hypothetical protein SAMN04488692_10276 [Halarsenatibacter silvermanii]
MSFYNKLNWHYESVMFSELNYESLVFQTIYSCLDIDVSGNCSSIYESDMNMKLLKVDKGHKIFRLEIKGRIFFLKVYADKNWKRRLKNTFRASEAQRIIKIRSGLEDKGINTLPVLLAGDYSDSKFLKKSFILSNFVPGINIEDFLNNISYQNLRRKILNLFARKFSLMLNYRYLNGDPSLINYFIIKNKGKFELVLLDLDNVKKLRFLPVYFIKRNISKLLAIMYARNTLITFEEKKILLEKIVSNLKKDFSDDFMKKVMKHVYDRLLKWGLYDVIDKHKEFEKNYS